MARLDGIYRLRLFLARVGRRLLPGRGRLRLFLFAALSLLLPVGCSKSRQPDPDVIARIGSREIRRAEFEAAMRRRAVGNDPSQKSALLDELLDHAALVETARAAGLDKDPELLRTWENLLVMKLRETRLEPQLTNAEPTAEQIERHYRTKLADFIQPAMRRGAVLVAELPAKISAEGKARLRQRLVEARDKALAATDDPAVRGFGGLAVEYSEDQATRYRGGDIGWIQAGRGDARFDVQVLDALFALPQPGAVSDVLETPRGYYLVKLIESRAERVKTLETVRPAIRHQLLVLNGKRLEAEWKQGVRAAIPTVIFPHPLEQVRVSQEPASQAGPPAVP